MVKVWEFITSSVSTENHDVMFSLGETKNDDEAENKKHTLFCEMDELKVVAGTLEWKEAARWLKFEEDVDDGGRWSKPFVGTLSLHSLLELRNCLTNGAIYLNIDGDDLISIVDDFLNKSISDGYLEENKREFIRNALLLKHIHQHEREFQKQLNNGERKHLFSKKASQPDLLGNDSASVLANLGTKNNLDQPHLPSGNSSSNNIKKVDSKPKNSLNVDYKSGMMGSSISINSSVNNTDFKINHGFMKKIPAGAESANVLVGEVDFLDHQFSAFIRLNKSCVLGDFTEVPVPTRFLFIILGPKGNINKYHEIGRSISTLMSDDLYHEVAYKAQERDELLKAFDQFLDQVTVLPPGEWDPNIRLDPPKKVPTQEERLEQLQNGSINKSDDDIHPHETDPGLEFTGRFCGGLIDDIKRKSPWYLSDFKDALSFQCLSSVLFMYFACLSPIITFGGLLGTATEFNMSALESLVSGALSGILYGLFSGQPMTILGSTGPVLVFETILFNFSKENGIDYIGLRAWVGLWTMVILITIVITDCSALVKYITRFTEESFASLIAIIFIKESIFKLLKVSEKYRTSSDPLDYYVDREKNPNCMRCILLNFNQSEMSFNVTDGIEFFGEKQCQQLGANYEFRRDCAFEPDVFYFSVFLYIFTFLFAMCLKSFRNSPFLPSTFRYKVSDFNIVIVILSAVLLDSYFGYNTPKLDVPLKFETTIPTRGWFINPITRNPDKPWLALLAIIPALLATILIFMDQHITAVIVNRRENKLKKGGGYHLDLLMVAITIGINSVLGLPWMVAATVLSINHVLSLKKETESSAPGEKPRFLGVIEQRVTNTLVFVLIGCSIFLSNLLRMIPMPVLYGVFLYMGISSLNGIQFMHRIILPFMPEKHQPDLIFLRHVRTLRVHLFTVIQLTTIALLFLIKSNKQISITFPIMVLALVIIRKGMDYVFTQKELSYLDDIMPEIVKRKIDDEEFNDGGESKASDETKPKETKQAVDEINISTELSKTGIWKDLEKDEKDYRRKLSLRRLRGSNKRDSAKRTKSGQSNQSNEIHQVDIPLLANTNTQASQIPAIIIYSSSGGKK